jgi:hypothetical protein
MLLNIFFNWHYSVKILNLRLNPSVVLQFFQPQSPANRIQVSSNLSG